MSQMQMHMRHMRHGLRFELTCGACPEQYDVFKKKRLVAYVRLRWGDLTCRVPDYNGELIYEHHFDDGFKGAFDDDAERDSYLDIIGETINKWLKEHP